MPYQHQLDDKEKRELLRIARATLREFLRSGRIPPGKPHRQSLVDPAGAFVTLHIDGELRGCIGQVEEKLPLYKAVQEMAVAAASRDPRFGSLEPDELDRADLEISVIGDRARITGPDEVVIGTHGLIIEADGHRGLLLPQVATDRMWDATTFLANVCGKADLSPDAWQRADAVVERFTAQVFSDQTHPPEAQ
jgi:AmmeMemoRadiSam system protein A